MQLELAGEETFDASCQQVWEALNDPEVLGRCIPGCRKVTEIGPDDYLIEVHLKVAAVGGTFEGQVSLHDKIESETGRIHVGGEGSIGTGKGDATFSLRATETGGCTLAYSGKGEVGGLVAGVGQRILRSVSRHLVKQFFTSLKKDVSAEPATAQK